jgi:hypothetical protein
MKSIGAVLAAALLLSACSYSDIFGSDIFGFELEIKSGEVKFKPMTVEVGGSRSHCSPGHPQKNWC